MKWLSDATLAHLSQVADEPDLSGTKYELLEKIGQGGMASVYLARDRELDRHVAIKVLAAIDQPSRERLLQEARIIARLEHPGIVPVHDVGVLPDDRVFYAMKRVQGHRLDEWLRTKPPLAERLTLFCKICQAVAFAHSQGVIHRDLKPQNIMVGSFGEVLVMDWGIAKWQDPQANTANTPPSNTIAGTRGYMSPEQLGGKSDQVNQRADIFALGGILSFLITGDEPSDKTYPNPIAPRPLAAIWRKARADDPEHRYPSALELADEVNRYLAGQRVLAHPESLWESTLRLGTKYRVAIVLVLAYLVMRLLLLFWNGR